MIVDSSAIVAILRNEDGAQEFSDAIGAADSVRMSAVNWLEAAIIIDSQGDTAASMDFDSLIRKSGIIVEPVTPTHAGVARQAYLLFGKGRHPARLNLGDCFAYALAMEMKEPLLYKGDDFSKTDVRRVDV